MKTKFDKFMEMIDSNVLGGSPIYNPDNMKNSDSYAPGDARIPKTIMKMRRNGPQKKKRKNK
jgi:hypothetical protein